MRRLAAIKLVLGRGQCQPGALHPLGPFPIDLTELGTLERRPPQERIGDVVGA
jgi:hypothetical protein